MQDDKFERWLDESAQSYNAPPAPDIDGMWNEIERQHFDGAARRSWWTGPWMRVAAALILGVGLGRISASGSSSLITHAAATPRGDSTVAQVDSLPPLSAPGASKYLGETVALLASLQSDPRAARNDKQLVAGAADLLNTTRFMLDSPDTNDPRVRGLLEDLELVLAQIVQMPGTRSANDVELIHQAMEQRDVMPRLRSAVANNYSAE